MVSLLKVCTIAVTTAGYIHKSHQMLSGSASLVVNRLKICLRNSLKQHTFHPPPSLISPTAFSVAHSRLQFRSLGRYAVFLVWSWPVFYCAFTCSIYWPALKVVQVMVLGHPMVHRTTLHSLSFVCPGFVGEHSNRHWSKCTFRIDFAALCSDDRQTMMTMMMMIMMLRMLTIIMILLWWTLFI